jgi:hypothetical protein
MRKIARLLGLAISAAALVVFVNVFADVLSEADIRGLAADHGGALLTAMLLYGLAYIPMTIAWITLASAAGARASRLALTRVLLISQIGKYLPGNFAQFLGRAFLARQCGVPAATSAIAIGLELAGVLAASGILAAVAMALGVVGVHSALSPTVTWISGVTAAAALLGSVWLFRSKGSRLQVFCKPVAIATCLYVGLLLLLALANTILAAEIGGDWSLGVAAKVAGAFVVSWLIGFATPGSPAGLGLRELTFFGLLAGSISQEALLLTAAAFRLVTIGGDVVAWLTGLILRGTKVGSVPAPIPA